jgi:perosamine synthetase
MRPAPLAAEARPSCRAIPHNRPTLGSEEARAAERVLASGWLAQGAEVEAFENEMCAYLGLQRGHAVATSSGTAALFLALWALGAREARVACPVYACSALTNAIHFAGATPVLIDNERDRPNVDIAAVARADAAIAIVPHMFGIPADITKVITAGGQGGMLVSHDRNIVDAARDFRQFDCRDDRKPRFNLQMTDLQAAIGREQLRKLPWFVARRDEVFAKYRRAGLEAIDIDGAAAAVRYRFVIRLECPRRAIEALARHDITAIVPLADWELLAPGEYFPNAAALARTTVSLPIYPSLSDEDTSRVIDAMGGLETA